MATKRGAGAGRRTSCGVVVTDGAVVVLGRFVRRAPWGIPKGRAGPGGGVGGAAGGVGLRGGCVRRALGDIREGMAEPGEAFVEAAVRELREETGLAAPPDALRDLGVHRYLSGKDLALFLWRVEVVPAPEGLRCTSFFRAGGGGAARGGGRA